MQKPYKINIQTCTPHRYVTDTSSIPPVHVDGRVSHQPFRIAATAAAAAANNVICRQRGRSKFGGGGCAGPAICSFLATRRGSSFGRASLAGHAFVSGRISRKDTYRDERSADSIRQRQRFVGLYRSHSQEQLHLCQVSLRFRPFVRVCVLLRSSTYFFPYSVDVFI